MKSSPLLLLIAGLFISSCGPSVNQPEGQAEKDRIDSIRQDSTYKADELKKQQVLAFDQTKTIDSTEEKGLRMIVEIISDSLLKFTYKNTGAKSFRLWTETKGYSLTWNYVDFEDNQGRIYTLNFDPGMREQPGIATAVELLPGKSVTLKENLIGLLRFRISQKQIEELKNELYHLSIYYDSSRGPMDKVSGLDLKSEHWNGRLKVSELTFLMH